MKRSLGVFLLLIVVSCRSSRAPDDGFTAANANEAWKKLAAASASFEGGRVLASISIPIDGKRRTFRARLDVARSGDYALTALSPIGTELFGITVAGSEAMVTDRRARKYWRGPVSELAGRTSPLFALDREALSRGIFGLPDPDAICDSTGTELSCRTAGIQYRVTRTGITSIEATTGDFMELGPAFPPEQIRFRDAAGSAEVTIRILEIVLEPTVVSLPVLESDWECCPGPTVPYAEKQR